MDTEQLLSALIAALSGGACIKVVEHVLSQWQHKRQEKRKLFEEAKEVKLKELGMDEKAFEYLQKRVFDLENDLRQMSSEQMRLERENARLQTTIEKMRNGK